MRINLNAVPPLPESDVDVIRAAIASRHEGFETILDVEHPPEGRGWTRIDVAVDDPEEFTTPCGSCWSHAALRRHFIHVTDRGGIVWVGQCEECGEIHYALPPAPVDLIRDDPA